MSDHMAYPVTSCDATPPDAVRITDDVTAFARLLEWQRAGEEPRRVDVLGDYDGRYTVIVAEYDRTPCSRSAPTVAQAVADALAAWGEE